MCIDLLLSVLVLNQTCSNNKDIGVIMTHTIQEKCLEDSRKQCSVNTCENQVMTNMKLFQKYCQEQRFCNCVVLFLMVKAEMRRQYLETCTMAIPNKKEMYFVLAVFMSLVICIALLTLVIILSTIEVQQETKDFILNNLNLNKLLNKVI